MKFVLFFGALAFGVPLLAAFATSSERFRHALGALLVFSPMLGDAASINFLSVEHYRGPDRGFEITLTDLLALSLVLSLLSRHSARLRLVPPVTLPMLMLFGFGAVSTAQSGVPLFGIFTLWKAVRLFLLYWCVVNLIETGVPDSAFRHGFTAAGLLMLTLALKQKYVNHMYRVSGPFDHSNGIPLYANLVIPGLVVWAVADRRLSRRQAALTLLAALGLLFAVQATQSRAGLILGGGVLFGALVVAHVKAPSQRVTRTASAVVLLVAIGGALAAPTIVRRFREAPESSEEARHEFNQAARLMAHERWLGVGLNNFSRALTEVDRYHDFLVVMKNEEEGGVAHHIYWLTAAELGFPALLVFVFILARFVWLALREGLRRPGLDGALLLGFLLGFAALHVQGTLEWGLRITPITCQFTLCVGFVAGIAQRKQVAGQAAPQRGQLAAARVGPLAPTA